jgi:predicted DNA-binding transcriptional regulator YafY
MYNRYKRSEIVRVEVRKMKLERLLGITMELLSQKKVTAPELAEKFEVSVRTIYRDMDKIGQAGIPILASSGNDGGFELMPGYFLTKQQFTLEELAMMYQFFKAMEQSSMAQSATSIARKLSALQPNINQTQHILFQRFASTQESQFLDELHAAILHNEKVQISYTDAYGRETEREMIPYHLIWEKEIWYVEGYCLLREAKRYFRVSRITHLEKSGKLSTEKPKLEEESNDEEMELSATLLFDFSAKQRVVEQFQEEWAEVTEIPEGLLVKTEFFEAEYALKTILSYGKQVTVLSPDSLKSDLLCYLKEIKGKYEEDV